MIVQTTNTIATGTHLALQPGLLGRSSQRRWQTRWPLRYCRLHWQRLSVTCAHLVIVVFTTVSMPLPTHAAAAKPASAVIDIVVAGPFSGPGAAITHAMKASVQEIANTANGRGGIHGRSVRVSLRDDGCSADSARHLATELSREQATVVIGHPCTNAALAAAEVYAGSTTLFIATHTRHAALTDVKARSPVLRLAGRDDAQGRDIATVVAQHFREQSIAVVHDRTRYARRIFTQTLSSLRQKGATRIIEASITGGDKDFSSVVTTVGTARAVIIIGFPLEAGLLYRQLRRAGSTAAVVATETVVTAELAATFGHDAAGLYAMIPTGSVITSDAAVVATSGDTAGGKTEADQHSAEPAALAAQLVVAALQQREGVTRDALLNAIRSPSPRLTPDSANDQAPTIGFAANGDAEIASFRLVRFDGTLWNTSEALSGGSNGLHGLTAKPNGSTP